MNLRDLLTPIPQLPAPPLWDRLTHGLRCNNRTRITPTVRACSVCGDMKGTR